MKKNDLFNRVMRRIQDKAGNTEQKGIGPYSQDEDDMDDADHDGGESMIGAQLGNGMRAMREKMMKAENNETPEDEANESPEYQVMEDKMGIEKHKERAGKHLFPKKGLNIMIAIAQQNRKRR